MEKENIAQDINNTIDTCLEYLKNMKTTRITSVCEERGYDMAIADLENIKIFEEETTRELENG